MKVVFVNTDIGHDTSLDHITLYKTYEVKEVESFWSAELSRVVTLYKIKTDNGKYLSKNAKLFVGQEEFRNMQIEKLFT